MLNLPSPNVHNNAVQEARVAEGTRGCSAGHDHGPEDGAVDAGWRTAGCAAHYIQLHNSFKYLHTLASCVHVMHVVALNFDI